VVVNAIATVKAETTVKAKAIAKAKAIVKAAATGANEKMTELSNQKTEEYNVCN